MKVRRQGFTLIELMVVVAILGVLAALAVPTLVGYARQAKTSEATTNLNSMFKAAATFYQQERTHQGLLATISVACIVEGTPLTPANPDRNKVKFEGTGGFTTLGFHAGDYVYFGYAIDSPATAQIECGYGANTHLYTFRARGDLDGDMQLSTCEMAAGSDANNQLYHARGLYIIDMNE